MEFKKLKCPSCGGKIEIPEDSNEIICSYCGSKVIIDDKATEVGRIKKAEINAKKELDEHEFENKKKKDEYNDEREYKKKKNTSSLKGWSIALLIICLLFTFTAFNDGKIISLLIGIVQIAAFGYSTLLCLDVLPEKIKNLHKIVFIGGCVLIIPFILLGDVKIGGNSSSYEKAEEIIWSEYVLNEKLPEPETLEGRLISDSSNSLSLYIMGVDKDEYNDYVSACKNKGYTVDIYNSSSSFSAKNEEGYSLNLYFYEDDKKYSITLNAPEENETTEDESTEDEPEEESKPSTNNGLRSDFKTAMDEYESFMNEYVEFMKKYTSNPSDISLLKEYSSYLDKYSKFTEEFEKWDDADLNNEEAKYYLEVQTRINKKLLEIQ